MRVKGKHLRTGDNLSYHPVILYYEKVLRSFINEETNLPKLGSRIIKNSFVFFALIAGIFLFGKFSTNIDYALHLNVLNGLIRNLDKFGFSIFLFVIGLGSMLLLIIKPKEDHQEFKRFKKLCYFAFFVLLIISFPFLDAFRNGFLSVGLFRLLAGSLIIFAVYNLIKDFKHFSIAAVKRSLLIHSVIFLFFGIILTFPGLDVILFPSQTPDRVTVKIELPDGSRLFKTNEITTRVESIINKIASEKPSGIKHFVTQVGATSSWTGSQDTSNYGEINIDFYKSEDRKKLAGEYHVSKNKLSPYTIITYLRKEITKVPGAKITIQEEESGPRTGKPVLIELSGDDLSILTLITEKVKKVIKHEEGVVNLTDSLKEGGSEIQIIVDRPKAALLGVNTMMLASTLRTAINGTKASTLRRDDEDKEIEINVKLNNQQRNDFNTLKYLPIPTLRGSTIPLSDIAKINTGTGYGAITHVDFKRVINVEADVSKESGRSAFAVVSSLKKKIAAANISLPEGYALTFRGQQEEQKKSNKFLAESFLIAIFLIALVLVSEFNSIVLPLIILFTVILSIIGVGIGLFFGSLLFRGQFQIAPFVIIMTGVGVITLAGIVVNNAIILLDYTILLRKKGVSKVEAIVKAGITRFRPVLLTAVTTILGLLPMSTGISIDFTHRILGIIPILIFESDSSQWWAPLADAVIFGLAFATVLTLIVVPVLYYYLSDIKVKKD
ncbi:MAG: efflux RND transporter permease subunit [Candidatus Margulisiibacteriota bacterium]|jgi:multidrug efflux pump subunit AcrB